VKDNVLVLLQMDYNDQPFLAIGTIIVAKKVDCMLWLTYMQSTDYCPLFLYFSDSTLYQICCLQMPNTIIM
jgi:hypothetical protein